MVIDINILGALIDINEAEKGYTDFAPEVRERLTKAYNALYDLLENCPTDEIEIKPFEKDYMPYYDG